MDGTRLSAQDALWLTMDRPNNLMVIILGCMFASAIATYKLGIFAIFGVPVFAANSSR